MGAFFGKKKNQEIRSKAKSEEFDFDEFSLDEDDFGFEDTTARKPSKKALAKITLKEAGKSLAEGTGKGLARELIPGDFEHNLMEVGDLAKHTKDEVSNAVKTVTSELKKALPPSLRKMMRMGDPDSPSQKGPSEEEMRMASMENTLNDIFKNGKSADTNAKSKEKAEELAVAKVGNELTMGMANDISKLTGFFTKIGAEYYKKSLELQFKSYFLQSDMLKITSTYFKAFNDQFDKIVKNTGLPEHVKITSTERVNEKVANAMADVVYSTVFSKTGYLNGVKNNISRKIKNSTSSLVSKIRGSRDFLDSSGDAPGGRSSIFASLLGQGIGEKGAEKLLGRIMPFFKKKYGNNKYLQELGYSVDSLANNPESFAARMRNKVKGKYRDAEDMHGLGGWLARAVYGGADNLLDVFNVNKRSVDFKKEGLTAFKDAAIFDKNVHRNITEAIPMYLSKILVQTQYLNSRYAYVNRSALGSFTERGPRFEELRFDFHNRKLDTMSNIKDSFNKKLAEENGKGNKFLGTASSLTNAASRLLKSDKRNKKINRKDIAFISGKTATKGMEDYLDSLSKHTDLDMSYDNIITNATSENADPRIRAYLETRPDLKRTIEIIQRSREVDTDDRANNLSTNFNATVSNIRDVYPVSAVEDLFRAMSKILKKEKLYVPERKACEEIAIIFTRFVFGGKGLIIPDDKILKKAIYGSADTDWDMLEGPFGTLLTYISDINLMGSRLQKALMGRAFDQLNTSIRVKISRNNDGADKLVEKSQDLFDYNPDLYDRAESVSLDNIITGTLNTSSGKDAVDSSKVDELFKNKTITAREEVDRFFKGSFITGMGDLTKEVSDIFNDDKKSMASAIMEASSLITKKAKEVANIQQGKLKDAAKNLSDQVKKLPSLSNKGIKTAIVTITNNITNSGGYVDNLIKINQETHAKAIANLEQLRRDLKDKSTADTKDLDDKIEKLRERSKVTDAKLTKLKMEVGSLSTSLLGWLETYDGKNIKNFMTSIHGELSAKVNAIKKLSEEVDAEAVN